MCKDSSQMLGMGEIQQGKEEELVLKGKNSKYMEVGKYKGAHIGSRGTFKAKNSGG